MATRPRHVLVTGGSRGIGLAIAQLFAKKTYRCTLISRSEQHLQAAVSSLPPLPRSPSTPADVSSQYQHGYIAGDITQGTAFWSTSASQPFGAQLPKPGRQTSSTHPSRIDVLVHCAGISQTKLFSTLDESAMQGILATNLTALMHGTKFLLRNGYMGGSSRTPSEDDDDDAASPVIINVASLLGLRGGYGAVAYAAAKAGVLGFTRALATEYASHRVRVNAVVPGYIDTDMTKDLHSTELEHRIPLGRFGTPAEVAHAALFLAENQYAHNCVVNLDGGLSAV